MSINYSKVAVYVCIFALITISTLSFLRGVSSQDITKVEPAPPLDDTKAAATVNAKGRGFPRVSFEDGVDLHNANGENDQSASPRLATSADFDSDGTADLITADIGGGLRFYRGNVDSIYPNTEAAEMRRAAGTFIDQPFYPASRNYYLPIAPDHLEAGDFNGDGKQDILAARNGENKIYLLAGDGNGNLSNAQEIWVGGSVTALAVGEIGSQDGQTDAAVAVEGEKGPQLMVFEHPEGAFKNPPESIALTAKATTITIGLLDTDSFFDIAVGGGNRLTIVHGRGQAYPWDLMPEYGVKRPDPIIETRALPSEIAGITSGYFTEKRGQSLAILTTAGAILTLDSPLPANTGLKVARENLAVSGQKLPIRSTSKQLNKFAKFVDQTTGQDELFHSPDEFAKVLAGETEIKSEKTDELDAETRAGILSGIKILSHDARQQSIEGFTRAISPALSAPLARWDLQTIASDARLASAANSFSTTKLVKVRVSDAGRDELAFVDSSANQIYLMIRENLKRDRRATANEIVSLDSQTTPLAILPMRLNMDALSDLVVLRQGSPSPSVVLTAPSAVLVVNTADDDDDGTCDSSHCSLREAIRQANSTAGADTINFSIGAQTIHPETALPEINFPVSIIGTTGAGGQPQVEISGDLGEEGDSGLAINAANVVVRGLAINQFRTLEGKEENIGGSGIGIYNYVFEDTAGFCIIEGNYLGTDRTGTLDRGNEQSGLFIFDSDNNTVGGTAAAARNIMSGNGNGELTNGDQHAPGILIVDGGITIVQGNYVGLAANGSTRLANSTGIVISGANNFVGGTSAGSANVVSGNTHSSPTAFDPQGCFGGGIGEESVINVTTGVFVTKTSLYMGNLLGLNAAGNAAVSNCRTGFYTSPRNTATVGSISASGRNIVSGNTDGGLFCSPIGRGAGFLRPSGPLGVTIPEGYCKITGNNVGTDATGSFAIPNDHRHGDQVFAFNGALVVYNTLTFSTVGGQPGTTANSCTGHCNLVSGNGSPGIYETVPGITRSGNDGDVGIWNNFVGTNMNGTTAIPNYQGVSVLRGNTTVGGVVSGGGGNPSLGNLISGNSQNALFLSVLLNPSLQISQVQGNLIGTDASGISAIPNNSSLNPLGSATLFGGDGVLILGGSDPAARNVISGNNGTGIAFGTGVLTTPIVNNYIGVNKNGEPLGNTRDGVELRGSYEYFGDNNIGNVIANNGRNGVFIYGSTAIGNRMRFNSIYNNGALGIDLSADTTAPFDPDGVTENDCGDADTGPHGLQNYPILTAPIFNGDGTVTVGGAFGSKASQTYTLDFYSNSTADPSNYGEGETYIGSKSVTTDASGKTAFQFTSTVQVAPGLKITATASDIDGSTSEFSCFAGQCAVRRPGLTDEESAMQMLAPGCEIGFVVNINTDESDPNPADGICDVDLGTTGEQCSLRAAIETTNAIAGTDFISFDIPGGGIQTISPTTELPPITERVFVNATSQPGYSGTPIVEVSGLGTSITSNGIVFAAGSDGSSLSGLTINRFGDAGILIQANEVEITKSYIGVLADGINVDPTGRQRRGILITGAQNRIGGMRDAAEPSTGANNVIAGNSVEEMKIIGTSAIDNTIVGNAVGFTLADDPRSRIDEADGIVIDDGSSGTKVGENGDGLLRNVIQGSIGVLIRKSDGNFVINNGIGNSSAGIAIFSAKNNTIGGIVRSENGYTDRNLIANNVTGIFMTDLPDDPEKLKVVLNANEGDCDSAVERFSRGSHNSPDGTVLTTGNKIIGNLIGIRFDDDPIDDFSNCVGIAIDKASGNFIGSEDEGYINFISGNEQGGVNMSYKATENVVQKNYIGTTRTGISAFPNFIGVSISGENNKVLNNIIAGNTESGVQIDQGIESDPVPTGNLVEDNKIGLNRNNGNLANLKGVFVAGISNTIRGNTISGNTISGVDITFDHNFILNNLIGTDPTGTQARPNDDFGILVSSSTNTISGNLISGNGSGLTIARDPAVPDAMAENNIVQGNYIGTNSAGTTALPGQTVGIAIANGASNNLIGGTTIAAKNIISGNTLAGILIQPGIVAGATAPSMNLIQGNYIGTSADGTQRIPNEEIGIDIDGASRTTIGGFGDDMPGARNVVSGNGGSGIRLTRGALLTRISGNYIGTQADGIGPLGNLGNGIRVGVSTTGTIIGGPEPSAGNTIAYNGKNGIAASEDAGNNNIIDPNSIFANALLGIDFGEDGHTPNDPDDADTGPNNLQNYPVIVSKQIVNDELILGFNVDSAPENSDYGTSGIYVEFFKADASGEGELLSGFDLLYAC